MAQNGWYIEQIITDLQSGKIDEFVKKEGKYYNYIKGDDTSFTNASDTVDNTAVGNLDFQEFTIQGIGVLQQNATTTSGTPPSSGFNVQVNFQNNNNDFTVGTFNIINATTLPATGTVTITPNPGFAIAAASFTALGASLLPSWLQGFTFADTGTPLTASNEVIITINFNVAAVGSNLSHTEDITLSAQQTALVLYEANLHYEGILNHFGLQQETVTNSVSYASQNVITPPGGNAQSGITQFSTQVQMFIAVGVPTIVANITVTPGPNTFFDLPGVQSSIDITSLPAAEQPLYQTFISHTNQSGPVQMQVVYTPDGSTNLDDNNDIFFHSNASVSSNTLTFQNATALAPNTGGAFFIDLDNPSGLGYNVTNLPSWVTSINNSDLNTVVLTLNPNNSGAPRQDVINLFSFNNFTSTPDDTLTLTQAATNSLTTLVANNYNNPGIGNQYGPSVVNYDGSSNNALIVNHFPIINGKFIIHSNTDCFDAPLTNFIDPTTLNPADLAVLNTSIAAGNANMATHVSSSDDWVIVNVTQGSSFNMGHSAYVTYTILPNEAGQTGYTDGLQRTATLTFTHPSDSSITSSCTITQEAEFNPTVNKVIIRQDDVIPSTPPDITGITSGSFLETPTASFAILADSTATPSNGEYIVEHSSSNHFLYIDIPPADTDSSNPFIFPTLQLPFVIATQPNDEFQDPNLNEANQPYFDITNVTERLAGPLYSANAMYQSVNYPEPTAYDPFTLGVLTGSSLSTPINYRLAFDVTENDTVNISGVPVGRTFDIHVVNPENNPIGAFQSVNATATIKQKAAPFIALDGGNNFTIAASSSSITITGRHNGSTNMLGEVGTFSLPTVGTYELEAAGVTQPSFQDSLSIGSPLSPFNVNTDVNGGFEATSQVPVNFGPNDITIRCAAWHSTINDPIGNQVDPTLAGTVAGLFEIFVPVTQPILNFTNINSVATPLPSANGNSYNINIGSGSATFVLFVEYNGLTNPNETNGLVIIEYADDVSGSYTFTQGTPTWFTASSVQFSQIGAPGANTFECNPSLAANGTSNPRSLRLKYIHSDNNTFQEHITITQPAGL